jgi:hypothetical protein
MTTPRGELVCLCPNTIVSKLVFDWTAGATDLGHVHNDIAAIFEVLGADTNAASS